MDRSVLSPRRRVTAARERSRVPDRAEYVDRCRCIRGRQQCPRTDLRSRAACPPADKAAAQPDEAAIAARLPCRVFEAQAGPLPSGSATAAAPPLLVRLKNC